MRESELRSVLLVKAIEESDRDGTVVTAADRVAASKEARRALGAAADTVRLEGGRLPAYAQRLLVHRARGLLQAVRVRHPFVDEIIAFAPGTWITVAIVGVAFAVGVGLSALDGTHRINVLAFPLWGIVAWNLLVYGFVCVAWSRHFARGRPAARWLPAFAAHAAMQRLSRLIARSRRFHAPLAGALGRFALEWQEASRPMLAARAARLFHAAAAVLGVGLIAGFYVRGVALDYRAGWESTFLDAHEARSVLRVLYAPASWITGIGIPDAPRIEAMRWRDGHGGESAAPWIHLLAATALVFVVVPRTLLALAGTIALWRAERDAPLPSSLTTYFDGVFREVGLGVAGNEVRVIPHAYAPSSDALARLRTQGRSLDVHPAVAYGDEDAFAAALRQEAPANLMLLFTSAATPEDETHGRMIDAARDAAGRWKSQLDVVVDEGPYAMRMGAGMKDRVDERRRAWRQFVAARGLEPRFVDLSQ